MNKRILLAMVVVIISFALMSCTSGQAQVKITNMRITSDVGVVVVGSVDKGTLNKGDVVRIVDNGSKVDDVTIKGIINRSTSKVVNSASKGDKVTIRLGDISGSDVKIGDTLIKEDN
ncbi:translation elongation factor EF-1alpha [Clostridium acetobutylicum]|uniref:Reductase/isomerase/elongation factor common domain n=1 Tax=Clostridium acetobutylicum (strain ATCC 824 / DSM 792 / JCM 1419 / IAM 19013 / LMG 5710 / NBRC 13948 / NRRL B-527 / VKM B-1787 / 2291 / W) TaxID=272562 RepID=Q97G24_CLOAB|nr:MULTISPECIES: reductase [Clostridium]AAK80499.1 Reductase/isomerase/elongation factor common domain [Clostridium acetobutylicum ATCC 824]ADZ21598.1 Reductase/isomerase/elongation factor common domain protein [Clostridium acetobutylicum EA 2018]AEI32422.1 reductase/isomerase/elongation factor domain-containing protein [Clostridium acetobutylicum DSM 1731]AWV79083.1 reductase [Clostridium acetobutylicum]MBC2394955.1 reductase [Clostridium acetobutylicum]